MTATPFGVVYAVKACLVIQNNFYFPYFLPLRCVVYKNNCELSVIYEVLVIFSGKNCELDETEVSGRLGHDVEEKAQTSNSGMVAGAIVATLFSAVFLLLWLYYRRRVKSLKTELAHVQYHADPGVSPGVFLL